MKKERQTGPEIIVEQVSEPVRSARSLWTLRWRVQNISVKPLSLLAVWLPHGQFKSLEREIPLDREVSPWESIELEIRVACSEPPGKVVENGFLIFRVLWLGKQWRVFVRVRVVFGDDGQPKAKTESITSHPVAFSER